MLTFSTIDIFVHSCVALCENDFEMNDFTYTSYAISIRK